MPPAEQAGIKNRSSRAFRLKLRPVDVVRLLRPYVTVRMLDQIKAVAPLAGYLFLFQLLILRQSVQDSGVIAGGLAARLALNSPCT